jgi:hypothetical protein
MSAAQSITSSGPSGPGPMTRAARQRHGDRIYGYRVSARQRLNFLVSMGMGGQGEGRTADLPLISPGVVAVADHGSWGGSRLAACRRPPASHLAGLGSAPSGRTGEPCLPSPSSAHVPPHAARARGHAHGASLPASEAASYRHANRGELVCCRSRPLVARPGNSHREACPVPAACWLRLPGYLSPRWIGRSVRDR